MLYADQTVTAREHHWLLSLMQIITYVVSMFWWYLFLPQILHCRTVAISFQIIPLSPILSCEVSPSHALQLLPLNVFASSLCVFFSVSSFFSTLYLRAFIFPLMSVHHTQLLLLRSSNYNFTFHVTFFQSTAVHGTTDESIP